VIASKSAATGSNWPPSPQARGPVTKVTIPNSSIFCLTTTRLPRRPKPEHQPSRSQALVDFSKSLGEHGGTPSRDDAPSSSIYKMPITNNSIVKDQFQAAATDRHRSIAAQTALSEQRPNLRLPSR